MPLVIARVPDHELIAVCNTDVASLPAVPDNCLALDVSQALYDQSVGTPIFDGHGRPIYTVVGIGGTIGVSPINRDTIRTWYAIVRTSDRAIMSLDNSQGALDPGLEHVEITKADYGMIMNAQRLDQDGGPAWQCAVDGTVTPLTDGRYILMLTTPGDQTQFADGDTVQVDAQLQQPDGTPITSAAGTRKAPLIRTVNGQSQRIDVQLTNGAATLSRVLPVGQYAIASGDPSTFRCAGATAIEVAAAW